MWWAKKITKPNFTVAESKHVYLGHTFYYPGNVTWNEITVEMVDPVSPDASINLSRILFDSGKNKLCLTAFNILSILLNKTFLFPQIKIFSFLEHFG